MQYFKLIVCIIGMLMYVGSEKPWLGDSIKFYFYFTFFTDLWLDKFTWESVNNSVAYVADVLNLDE